MASVLSRALVLFARALHIAAELLFAALFIGAIVLTWPSPPWTVLEYGGIALMILAPFVFLPFSKTLVLAFDLIFRPATPDERSAGVTDSARAR